MVEKQASSEIAESRERFEKAFAAKYYTVDQLAKQTMADLWDQAERDTRERVAQITLPLLDRLAEWCSYQPGWREAREFESEIRQVSERIRGEE